MRLRVAPTGVALCAALLGAAAPGAQVPRVAAFLHHDSLAVAVDCAPLLGDECRDRLHEGYPLSFVLELTLMRHDPVWFDTEVISREAHFRITHEKWDARYLCALHDFNGRRAEVDFPRFEDILLELEDRLSTTLRPVTDLDAGTRYYFAVAVQYRTLTLEDVKSAEEWLRGTAAPESTAQLDSSRLPKGGVLGFLWDLAGLKGERRKIATQKFRLGQLRRLE